MDISQLKMFLSVVEQGGFNKAAAKLYISQSAISRKISLLEAELREKLFLRVGNRIMLTPAGEALVRHSRFILRQIKTATVEISDIANLKSGELSIGAGMTACVYLLPPVLKKFRETFNQVDVKVFTGGTDDLVSKIRDGRIDLGILTLPIVGDDLLITKLLTEELVIVVSQDHPWSKRSQIKAAELEKYPLIIFSKETNTRHLLDRFFKELGVTPPIAMELSNFATIKPLVEINLGISILPYTSVEAEIANKRLHVVRVKGNRLQRDIGLVHLKAEALPRAVSELIRFFSRGNSDGPASHT